MFDRVHCHQGQGIALPYPVFALHVQERPREVHDICAHGYAQEKTTPPFVAEHDFPLMPLVALHQQAHDGRLYSWPELPASALLLVTPWLYRSRYPNA